jgi:hypothetical protein
MSLPDWKHQSRFAIPNEHGIWALWIAPFLIGFEQVAANLVFVLLMVEVFRA